MKFNISYPLTGQQKIIEIDDDKKCSIFFDKRMGSFVEADQLGDQFKGYVLKITGGNDKDGFPMRQGIMVKGRTKILMRKNQNCYWPGRSGERKRRSVRGCIVGTDIGVLAVSIIKKGDANIEGLTGETKPCRLGPKRLSKLRRLFGYKKSDGVALVKKNIIRRTWVTKDGKKRQKAPKIQRLVTENRLRRKRLIKKVREAHTLKASQEAETYRKLLAEIRKKNRKQSADVHVEQKVVAPVAPAKVAQKPTQTKGAPVKQTVQPVATKTQAPKKK